MNRWLAAACPQSRRACTWLAGLLLAAPVAAGDVVVVDPGGGPGAMLLSQAIAAAADGDTILLRPGDYWEGGGNNVVIEGKGLAILADSDAHGVVTRGLTIRELPAGSTILLRGLTFGEAGSPVGSENRLSFRTSEGSIWVEDCTSNGRAGYGTFVGGVLAVTFPGGPGLAVMSSDAAVFQRCTFAAGNGFDAQPPFFAGSGGHGADVRSSHATFQGCTLTGTDGGHGDSSGLLADGGSGLFVNDLFAGGDEPALVHVQGCALSGGDAGDEAGDDGGHGVAVSFTPSLVTVRDSTMVPGSGGPLGTPGQAEFVTEGAIATWTPPALSVSVPAPLREGDASTFTVVGNPGDLVTLWMAAWPGYIELPGRFGAFVLDPLTLVAPIGLGLLGPGGTLTIPFTLPNLPDPFLDGLAFPIQGVASGIDGTALGGATMLVWLDGSL